MMATAGGIEDATALLLHAARHHGVTLSQRQFAFATNRLALSTEFINR